jgi:predicted nucleic acid-binding protein
MVIVLDTGPLSMVTNPRASEQNRKCVEWLSRMISKSTQIVIPEIADYELRRELIRAEKTEGIGRREIHSS